MKIKKRDKQRRDEAIEYLNIPSWDETKKEDINFKDKKKYDVIFTSSEKEKLDEIEERVETLLPKNKKGKRKKMWQLLFILFFSGLSITLLSFIDDSGATPLGNIIHDIRISMVFMVLLMIAVLLLADTCKYIYLIWVTTKKFRPFISFKVGIVGRYYDSITPLATGGQPFQMYYLSKRDIPVGVASSIPLLRFFIGQLSILLIALVLMLFVPFSSEVAGVIDPVTFTVTKSAAFIGLAVTSFLPIFLIFLIVLPNAGKKFTSWVLKLASKLKIVKDYDTTYTKVIKHVEEFQTSMRYVSSRVRHILAIMLLTAVEYLAFLSIPYFICLAFGISASLEFYLTILALNAFSCWAVTLVPTPGTSGAAETVFLLLFKSLFPIGAFWAMIFWRFMTYYIFIILGLIVMLYDFVKQTAKERFIERRKFFNIREKLIPRLNSQSETERLANLTVLKQIEKEDKFFIPKQREYDIKLTLKTAYSSMPCKPSFLAYKLHEAGCQIVGIMDDDSLVGAEEFYKACEILDMKCLLGVEVKTYISRYKKRDIRINNINQKDIINLSMTCIPIDSVEKINDWLGSFVKEETKETRKC